MQPVYVSGHRNPDTDSIAAAVGYAELKSRLDPDTEYIPVRLGELNPQTRWVLEHADAAAPVYLPHILVRAVDVMRTTFPSVEENAPLRAAGEVIVDENAPDMVPVTDADGVLTGAITERTMARHYARELVDGPSGAAGSSPSGSCHDLIETAPPVAAPEDIVSDVAAQVRENHHRSVIVIDAHKHPIGLLTEPELMTSLRRRVILVDHAERQQSIPGIEKAEIIEILDHHHIGSIETSAPVAATFDPVGSTATLVTERFRDKGIEPTRSTAMLLMSAVLSDTVILNSPTTTDRDAAVLEYLGALLAIDPQEFGRRMFEETTDVSGVSAEDLVRRDAKVYQSGNGTPFLIAQVEVVGEAILERESELLDAMRRERRGHDVEVYALMITDVLEKGTKLLLAGDSSHIGAAARAFGVEAEGDSKLDLPGVMSRKKQVAPVLLAAL